MSTIFLSGAKNIEVIGLSGGVGYNEMVANVIRNKVEEKDFKFLMHSKIPCGGGVSFGQGVVGRIVSGLFIGLSIILYRNIRFKSFKTKEMKLNIYGGPKSYGKEGNISKCLTSMW